MENVQISNPKQLEDKMRRIRRDGKESFHVVSDFDKTLTKAFTQGKRVQSSLALMREGGYLTPDYAQRSFDLHDEYHPIELNENLSVEEKNDKMLEWWQKALDLTIECGLKREVIEDIIKKNKTVPRQGSLEFYDILSENGIPILIFSAGLGDVIKGFLEKEGKMTDNIYLIANFYDFDERGNALGYKDDIIHTFNKNEYHIKKISNYNEIKERKNVILLGDSLGDINMTQGMEADIIIKIGFLNERIDENLETFSKSFDVVIFNDSSMDYVNKLINKILS